MTVFGVSRSLAQGALWVDVTATPRSELLNGVAGIGPFYPAVYPSTAKFLPERLLSVHSTVLGVSTEATYYPAYLRLQTQVEDVSTDDKRNEFGNTGIEFFSGSTINAGKEWCVGLIQGVTSGRGISEPLPSADDAVFKETNPQTPIDLRGGLAFYCSPSSQNTLPNASFQIEVMRIVDGNVGIGTKYPKSKVQVNDLFTIHSGGSSSLSHNAYYNGSVWKTIVEAKVGSAIPPVAAKDFYPASIGMWNGSIGFYISEDRPSTMAADATITWKNALQVGYTGNISIGTEWGSSRLVVKGESHGSGNSALNVTDDENKSLLFVRNDGKVNIGKSFIGSTHTDYLLSVSGKVVCNDLRVLPLSGNWPDYVFSASHKLMTLEEVEKSVKANQHLPGMPSAKEVEANGIDVGEMQRKLLEKMEEMTLYMIELKKENAELRAKIDAVNLPTLNK